MTLLGVHRARGTEPSTNSIIAYSSGLKGDWVRSCWEATDGALLTDFAAAAPGKPWGAVEVRFRTNNAYNAFGLADRKPGYDNQYKYLNEFRTIEFDIYFEPDSTGVADLTFILEDATYADEPHLVDFIPNWATMTDAQRYGHWFHVVVDLTKLHPNIPRFEQFLLFNAGTKLPHFRIGEVKLSWVEDVTPPVVQLGETTLSLSYDRLQLTFTTDEATLFRVEYGISDFSSLFEGPATDYLTGGYATNHQAVLGGLKVDTTYRYRIVALDHRTDPVASPNEGVYLGAFTVPPAPVTPPPISGLSVSNVLGNRATVLWKTERPCSAQLTYQKAVGTPFTRTFSELVTNSSYFLDLLEPNTDYSVTVVATDAFHLTSTQTIAFKTTAASAPTVTVTVDTAHPKPISPWIYGINFIEQIPGAPRNLTLNRHGGNRWTAYNWENNASNAGNDYFFQSDDYLGGGSTPGEALRPLIAADRTRGNASLMTVQMQGYVAADKNGPVDLNNPNHVATRFKQVLPRKNAAFTETPSTTDPYVYMDEFLWALGRKFDADIFADSTKPTFVSLDNEPELWPSTHQEIQPAPPTPADYIQKTINLSAAIKDLAPGATIFGPVHYGFYGIAAWQGAPGYSADYWFTDQYLTELKAASSTAGKRLLDVYDIHWYPEAKGAGIRIGSLTGTNLSNEQIQAIVQSPRSLWDTTYREDSWIADYFNGPIFILNRLQSKIDSIWPGTKLAVSEYVNGGDNHIAGTIAQADNLGVFASRGVFAASLWPTSSSYPFILSGFKMYRDFDGQLGTFGDVSLATVSSDTAKVAAYVSQDSKNPRRHVVVAINRSFASQDVRFAGLPVAGIAKVYRLEGRQTSPVFVGEVLADLASWVVTLPPLSVSTIAIESGARAPSLGFLSRSAGGDTLLQLTGATGVEYVIQASPDLSNWIPVSTNTISAEAAITVHDASAPSESKRFYRAISH